MRDLRFWRLRKAEDDDFDRELNAHLEIATDERLEAGLPPREAQLAALREFGSVALTKEELRERRTGAALERLWRETRTAGRRLLRSPAFTLATVLTLGLAISANIVIFIVVERVVLNPLPYPGSGRLVMLDFGMPSRNIPAGFNSVTTRQYFHYGAHARTLAALAVYRSEDRTITGRGTAERVRVARTTPSLAPVLRVTPQIGSWLPMGNARGAPPTAVLSHGLWSRRYGLDPGILGQAITLDGIAATVVGVMPASFVFPDPRVDAMGVGTVPAVVRR